jgi:hypothetical protein
MRGKWPSFDEQNEYQAGLPDFFLVKHSEMGKNIPNGHIIYQMAIKYTKLLCKINLTIIIFTNMFHFKALP